MRVKYIAVYVVGGGSLPLAFFSDREVATEWARENYYGNWLLKEVSLPGIGYATKREWEKAEKEAKELVKFFNQDNQTT